MSHDLASAPSAYADASKFCYRSRSARRRALSVRPEPAAAPKHATLAGNFSAVRIKLEAWRNIGRVIREMRKAGELVKHGQTTRGATPSTSKPKTLRDHGLSKHKAAAAEKLVLVAQSGSTKTAPPSKQR